MASSKAPQRKTNHNWVLATGSQPEATLGHDPAFPDGGNSANLMRFPQAVLCSPGGRLWVADAGNNRVLRFDNAAGLPPLSPANAVLGQAGFNLSQPGLSAARMDYPSGLALHPITGALWVADSGNNRVLRFDSAQAKANGAAADSLLGQLSFLSNTAQTTDRFMSEPEGVAFDEGGRLWVGDSGNARILRFENAAALTNWAPANGVLGQPDFFSRNIGYYKDDRIPGPGGLAVDPSGRLYVGDSAMNRVLWFNAAHLKPNGAPADGLLGQEDFHSRELDFGRRRISGYGGLAFDPKGGLWAGDYNKACVAHFPLTTPGVYYCGQNASKHFFMNCRTTPGTLYQWERSSTLGTWIAYGAPFTASLNFQILTDNNVQPSVRFYRVRELAP